MTLRPVNSFTASSEFVLGIAKGFGEVAQHCRADISDRGNVLADNSLFTSRSDISESVSTQTLHPSPGAVLHAIRRCLSGTGDVRTPETALGRLVQIGAPTRRSWMSQTAQGFFSPFRIG